MDNDTLLSTINTSHTIVFVITSLRIYCRFFTIVQKFTIVIFCNLLFISSSILSWFSWVKNKVQLTSVSTNANLMHESPFTHASSMYVFLCGTLRVFGLIPLSLLNLRIQWNLLYFISFLASTIFLLKWNYSEILSLLSVKLYDFSRKMIWLMNNKVMSVYDIIITL